MTTEPAASLGPRFRYRLPVIVLLTWIGAQVLDRRLEFLIVGAGAGVLQVSAGLTVAVLGAGLMAWGMTTFPRPRTATGPNETGAGLVADGPDRVTHHPVWLGLMMLYVGISIALNAAWPLVLLPLLIMAVSVFVIRPQERYLRAALGAPRETAPTPASSEASAGRGAGER